MYGFVDTVPGSGAGSTSLLSLRTLFNDVDLDEELTDDTGLFTTLTVTGRSNASQSINSFTVGGMDGAHEENNPTMNSREIVVKFRIKDKTNEGFRERVNRLNSLLTGSKQVLEFTDEEVIFYATLSRLELPEEESNDLIGNIVFYCSDPYKYGPELESNFPGDAVTITNKGTAPAKPIYELEVNEPTTFAAISNGEETMMIGMPYDEDQTPVDRYDTVFRDNASTLVGWTALTSGSSIPGGVVGGSMGVYDGYAFRAESFGENSNGWVGPAVKKSLSRAVQDFRMTMDIETLNRQGNVGKIQIDLLDAQDNVVASVQMVDATNGAWSNRAIITAGPYGTGHQIINHLPEGGGWNNFRGVLRIERIGNTFYAYVARVTGGRHHGRLTAQPFVDTLGEYSAPVTQVRVYIAKSKNYNPFPIYFHGGNVWEINDLSNNEVPYIGKVGDLITFNMAENLILINGEPRKDLKQFGSEYFRLKPGANHLVTMPEETFTTKVRYREPYR